MGTEMDRRFEPGYRRLQRSGELRRRADALWSTLAACRLCPRECGAARLQGERGACGAGDVVEVASYHPHFGEERPLVGRGGSGTIFLAHCGLRCAFCINWDVSQGDAGSRRTADELAGMMLELQRRGCHNINVVTPTHYLPHVVRALDAAAALGLCVPFVYNTSGWERLAVLRLLEEVVDVYLPDFKFWDGTRAGRYCEDATSYPARAREALLEMQRQVGVARLAGDGIVHRGLMVRHLVMPGDASGTREIVRWIAGHLPRDTYLNLMSQYRPAFRAAEYPEIARRLDRREYEAAVEFACDQGLSNLDVQGWPS